MKQIIILMLFLVSGATWAAHPLISDDTGTQGQGHWQFELNTDSTRSEIESETTRNHVGNATITYGIVNTVDLAINVPYIKTRTNVDPETKESGIGDVSLFAKWRIWERDAWSFAFKPGASFATGDENKGLGNGRSTVFLNGHLMYAKDAFTWMATVGATYNDNKIDARKQLWNVSTAIKYKIAERWAVLGDMGIARNAAKDSNTNPAFALIGAIYSPSEDIDLDVGYKRGLNKTEVDEGFGVGLTVRW